ncbi:MAG: YlbF family regulator [Oscillospiraceae bacterium]
MEYSQKTVEQFMQAAKALQQDPAYIELKTAREANDANAGLKDQIDAFNEVRTALNQEIGKGERDGAKVSELNDRINQLYNEIMTDATMVAFNDAKDSMNGLIAYINAIITAAVDGEDPTGVQPPAQGGCGPDGCSGCSGCG